MVLKTFMIDVAATSHICRNATSWVHTQRPQTKSRTVGM